MFKRSVSGTYGPISAERAYRWVSCAVRCQMKVMPLARQIASLSARTRAISCGGTSDNAVTVTIIGGTAADADPAGAAANAVVANSAAAAVVAISIMPAIDGCNRQKFDV